MGMFLTQRILDYLPTGWGRSPYEIAKDLDVCPHQVYAALQSLKNRRVKVIHHTTTGQWIKLPNVVN